MKCVAGNRPVLADWLRYADIQLAYVPGIPLLGRQAPPKQMAARPKCGLAAICLGGAGMAATTRPHCGLVVAAGGWSHTWTVCEHKRHTCKDYHNYTRIVVF